MVFNVEDERTLKGGKEFTVVDAGWNISDESDGSTKVRGRLAGGAKDAPAVGKRRGVVDGMRCDVDGNLWAAGGWVGDGYDGVHVFSPEGQLIGLIKLPEIGGNLCFGGPKRNRLYIAASTSIYAVYVETQGAHFC